MFNKKIRCFCGKKVNKKFEFCPFCGRKLFKEDKEIKKRKKEKDFFDEQIESLTKELSESFNMPFINSFPFKTLIKKLSKDIEKQFLELDREFGKMQTSSKRIIPEGAKKTSKDIIKDGKKIGKIEEFSFPHGHGFSLQIKIGGTPQLEEEKIEEIKEEKAELNKPSSKRLSEKMEKFSKLPRQEPDTAVRRLTDRIIYEISLPGVKDKKNIFINKLQNSIEIRAFSKDKAYFKLIPISLPIKNWKLEKEKLILELKV